MPNMYTPLRNGSIQTTYQDQQATALAGMPAFASDYNLIDAYGVGNVGDNGLEAGLAVIANKVDGAQRTGINEESVTLPSSTTTAGDIAGVTVRNQQMGTNSAGRACYFHQDMCNIMRSTRSGGRIWVQLAESAQPDVGESVYVVISGDKIGTFTTDDSALALPNMQFKSTAKDGIALVELL